MAVYQGCHVIGKVNALSSVNISNVASGCPVCIMGEWFAKNGVPADAAGNYLTCLPVNLFAFTFF